LKTVNTFGTEIMTDFYISAETFVRLSGVALQPDDKPNTQYQLACVRIEQQGGVAIALASYTKMFVGECLQESGEDGVVNVTIHPELLAIAKAEAEQSGKLHIQQAPGWTIARGVVTGRMFPLNAEVPGEWPDWRGLIPTVMPSKSNGAFVFSGYHISRMGASAPSGSFVLPRHVDHEQPVLVRDSVDPNWFGLFLVGTKEKHAPAEVPEWLVQ
jgi:hypothetical protein